MRLFGRFSKISGLFLALAGFIVATATVQAADNYAVVRAVRGEASYSNDKGGKWTKLKVGTRLNPNSVVRTAPASTVDLFLGDNGPVLRVTPDTQIGIDKLTVDATGAEKVIETQLDLRNGRILGNVKKLAAASRYEVKTPQGVAGIRGTEFDISADGTVTVISGQVIVVYIVNGNPIAPVVVNAGETVHPPVGGARPLVIPVTASLRDEILKGIREASGIGNTDTSTTGTTTGNQTIPDTKPTTDPVRDAKTAESPNSPGSTGGSTGSNSQ